MTSIRELIKRGLPNNVRSALIDLREKLGPPPLEHIVLHDYEVVSDFGTGPRSTLVIPTVSPRKAFGGITTGLEIFLELGKRTRADLRIVLDDFERSPDTRVVEECARNVGVDPASIEIIPRTEEQPRLAIRASDTFFTFNWWTTLNVRRLLSKQHHIFGGPPKRFLYFIQEYEPQFYPFSSTHMWARSAFDSEWPCWGVFNSRELYDYFRAQGHKVERAFVFEPNLSSSLRPFLAGAAPVKTRRVLVYGRPSVPRNCYPAVVDGLRLWAKRYPQFRDWEVVSVGIAHKPQSFGEGRTMRSLGKLSLQEYGQMLRTAGVGLSLMASPHPSYPPLEMAHFGVRTVTNTYGSKDLAASHPNIISIADVAAVTIADALAEACRMFESLPAAGWLAQTRRPSFLDTGPFGFLDQVVDAMAEESNVPPS